LNCVDYFSPTTYLGLIGYAPRSGPRILGVLAINQQQAMTSAPESYVGHKPVIKRVDFSMRGHISIYLQDGRIIIAPLSKFPSIKKMSLEKRKKYGLADGNTIIFQHCDEVYHLQDFLGLPEDYIHS